MINDYGFVSDELLYIYSLNIRCPYMYNLYTTETSQTLCLFHEINAIAIPPSATNNRISV